MCDGIRTADDVVEQIAEEYDAPVEVIRDDTTHLLAELARAGLLTLE